MEKTAERSSALRFGSFRLELQSGELRKGTLKIKLQEQPFQILLMLLERPGEVVAREELIRKLWTSDTFVDFDNGLNIAVRKLRSALGDDPESPRYIETLPRRGYRLLVAVKTETSSHADEPPMLPSGVPARPNREVLAVAGAAAVIVLGAAALAYFLTRPEPVPNVSNYVQLTHDGKPKELVATDGSRLYLVFGGLTYNQSIATMSVSGGEPTKIPTPSPNMSPLALSPDGSELLVADPQADPVSGPLWSLPVLGGSPRRLGDAEGQSGAWSPDGKLLAYGNRGDLLVAKADGTEPRKLVAMKPPRYIFGPVWSPDASKLRFSAVESLGISPFIWEVSLDGTHLHRLLPGFSSPADWESGAQWTADGKYFLFTSRGQLWALPRKNSFLHSGTKPIQLTSSPLSMSWPIPSKDGKKIFVVGRTFRGESMRYDAKSGQFVPFLGGISAEYYAFSKDGQWAAYVAYPEGNLWRSKVDGSERLELTQPPDYASMPRWSPDGSSIAFFEQTPNKPPRIYEVPAAGGTPRLLMPDDTNPQTDPDWSPDGNEIVFSGNHNDAASTIRILDLTTHQIETIPGSQSLSLPRWSPNGRYLFAGSSLSPNLMLFDFQTQKWTELPKGTSGWPNWSKDGQYVYFVKGLDAVYRMRVSDHKVERVADLKNFRTTGRWDVSLALAPDDSSLLLRDAGTQEVYALDWEQP